MRFSLPVLVLLFLSAPARAADTPCASDADCGKGQVCVALPCAVPGCAPDSGCPEPEECASEGVCQEAPWDGSCVADADCPAGFTCDEVDVPCATGACTPCTCACPAEGDCQACVCPPCEPPPPCTPTTRMMCQYHAVECKVDGDCNPGWTCQPEEVCMGTGCACPPCAPDEECGSCDCAMPEEPTCEVTGAWCQPKETACSTADDCAAGFECIERTVGVPCARPMCDCAPDAGDCSCESLDCPQPVSEKVCLPKGWAGIGYADGGIPLEGGVPTGEDDTPTTPPTTGIETPSPGSTDSGSRGAGAQNGGNVESAKVADGGNGCQSGSTAGAPLGLLLLAFAALLPVARRVMR